METNRAAIGARKRARTRKALIDAAMKLFARQGPDTPTIDDVIAEAGVARGTFYNYFDTRDDLLVAVASDVSDRLFARRAVIRRLADPAERVACTIRMFVTMAAEDPIFGWIIVRIALIAAPLGSAMRKYLAEDIRMGLTSGRFRPVPPQAAADLLLGFGLMAMRSVLRGEAGAGHAEDVAELILTALGVADAASIARRPTAEPDLIARAEVAVPPRSRRPRSARS